MPESQHVGYAGRTAEKFRFEGDPNEVMLRISKEAAASIVSAYMSHDDPYQFGPAGHVIAALEAMGIE